MFSFIRSEKCTCMQTDHPPFKNKCEGLLSLFTRFRDPWPVTRRFIFQHFTIFCQVSVLLITHKGHDKYVSSNAFNLVHVQIRYKLQSWKLAYVGTISIRSCVYKRDCFHETLLSVSHLLWFETVTFWLFFNLDWLRRFSLEVQQSKPGM